ncbi:hypothetical protein KUL97_03730 [Synechococcus sp. HK05]|uniref:hypothetical protein n=1 Tax=Synechococcus sp. HK05 TaxID=2725975 RepID=UPI001C393ED8|nr:hypothetical protein [Synechococcus sp. HK05]MBV2350817.1 hypothetical protein [Synechococcus sp. HK05]
MSRDESPIAVNRFTTMRSARRLNLITTILLIQSLIPLGATAEPELRLEPSPFYADGQVIPKRTAIVGRVLLDIVLDPERKYGMPVTLLSAIPIYDSNGDVAMPAGSIITAMIEKRDGGDYITVDKIVYHGLNIDLDTEGRLMPAQIRPEDYGQYIEQPKSRISTAFEAGQDSLLIPTLLGLAVANSYSYDKDGYRTDQQSITPLILGIVGVDFGLKLLGALMDKPAKMLPPLVEIPQDSLIVFTVARDIALPQSDAPETVLEIDQ